MLPRIAQFMHLHQLESGQLCFKGRCKMKSKKNEISYSFGRHPTFFTLFFSTFPWATSWPIYWTQMCLGQIKIEFDTFWHNYHHHRGMGLFWPKEYKQDCEQTKWFPGLCILSPILSFLTLFGTIITTIEGWASFDERSRNKIVNKQTISRPSHSVPDLIFLHINQIFCFCTRFILLSLM